MSKSALEGSSQDSFQLGHSSSVVLVGTIVELQLALTRNRKLNELGVTMV